MHLQVVPGRDQVHFRGRQRLTRQHLNIPRGLKSPSDTGLLPTRILGHSKAPGKQSGYTFKHSVTMVDKNSRSHRKRSLHRVCKASASPSWECGTGGTHLLGEASGSQEHGKNSQAEPRIEPFPWNPLSSFSPGTPAPRPPAAL